MPRDLFGDVTSPSITLGSRKWYSVPLSFCAHALIVVTLVVAPLMATGVLPTPSDVTVFVSQPPPELPTPPVVPAIRQPPPLVPNPHAAPVVEPDTIREEPLFDPGFEAALSAEVASGAGTIEGTAAIVVPPAPVEPPPPPAKPIRPGGDIKHPERVRYVAPIYPPLALAARMHGLVIVEAVIDAEGRVQDARVLRTDSPLFNDAALSAVREWLYKPTLLNGVPVKIVMTVTVQFRMQ